MARMKILLIQDVDGLGLAGEVYSVAGGYARNYLMPRSMALLATKGAMKQAEQIRQAGIRRRAQERSNAEAQAELITQQRLLFHVRAGDNDRLYGSVTNSDVAEKLSELVGFSVDRRRIQLGQAIRELGLYDVEVRLMAEVVPSFKVAVVREDENWTDAIARNAEAEAKGGSEEASEDSFEIVEL